MKTHTSSQSRIITVWLVLLAFLCCTMVPSIALAEKEMVIATEGDPGDGMDYSGGGSGSTIGDEGSSSSEIDTPFNIQPAYLLSPNNIFGPAGSYYRVIFQIQGNGQIQIVVIGEFWEWGAIR